MLEKENRMKKFFVALLASMLLCGVADAADGGLDAGADTDTDTDSDTDAGCTTGEAECSGDPSTWMWCNAANEWVETGCLPADVSEGDFTYSSCNCDPADPCGWTLDNYCDDGCLAVVDEMFDDSVDCTPYDGGSDSDSDVDVDADSDADTDTGDASPSGGDSGGCGCRVTGARLGRSLLSLVL
jgi:hypothetical protein